MIPPPPKGAPAADLDLFLSIAGKYLHPTAQGIPFGSPQQHGRFAPGSVFQIQIGFLFQIKGLTWILKKRTLSDHAGAGMALTV